MAEYSLIDQAASFLSAISASIKDSKLLASEETVKSRLSICENCPKLKQKNYRGRSWQACLICGCAYKRKVAIHGSKCPIGRW